jgi:dihydroxyacetone kinase phosphoprotein-dependent L subunit
MLNQLSTEQTKEMFLYVAEKIIGSKTLLTEVDSAIGDGDHGIGMSIGFSSAVTNLQKQDFSTINEIFKSIGMSLISSMGGASGVIFGTMFLGGIKNLENYNSLNLETLAVIFENSLKAIKERGKAAVGDKTMVDSFQPAVNALKEAVNSSLLLLDGLQAAEEKARVGMENTKGYIANFGRAKSLGERAIGHQDAGATSVWLIFKSIREWVERNR